VIEMVPLPAGFCIVDVIVDTADLGTTVTADVGLLSGDYDATGARTCGATIMTGKALGTTGIYRADVAGFSKHRAAVGIGRHDRCPGPPRHRLRADHGVHADGRRQGAHDAAGPSVDQRRLMTRRKAAHERLRPGPKPGFRQAQAQSIALVTPPTTPSSEAPQVESDSTAAPIAPQRVDALQRGRNIALMGETELRAYAVQVGVSKRDALSLPMDRLRVNCVHVLHALIDEL
jgi:hypothetical protein